MGLAFTFVTDNEESLKSLGIILGRGINEIMFQKRYRSIWRKDQRGGE